MLCHPIWLPRSLLVHSSKLWRRRRVNYEVWDKYLVRNRSLLAARHDIRRLLDFYDGADVFPNRQAF